MPRHCASSRSVCASSILAILLFVWCCRVTWRACCHTIHSIGLLQSPDVLTCSEVTFGIIFRFFLQCHCLGAVMHGMRIVFPDTRPATLLASPPSDMSLSLSTGGFSIVPPIRHLPSWVSYMTGKLDFIMSRHASRVWPHSVVPVSWKCRVQGQFHARN